MVKNVRIKKSIVTIGKIKWSVSNPIFFHYRFKHFCFIIKNDFAIEFKFETFTHVQMGCSYFKIEIKNKMDVARTLHGDKKNVTKWIILPNVTNNNNEICYREIANNWTTLKKIDCLKCMTITIMKAMWFLMRM